LHKSTSTFGKQHAWEEVNVLIINTTTNNAENSLFRTFRPSAGAIVNAKSTLIHFFL